MAKVEIHRISCDRCGAEVTVNSGEAKPAGWAQVTINLVETAGESTIVQASTGGPADICPTCSPTLRNWWSARNEKAAPAS